MNKMKKNFKKMERGDTDMFISGRLVIEDDDNTKSVMITFFSTLGRNCNIASTHTLRKVLFVISFLRAKLCFIR